ncbi:Macrolide export ATP-binding/permease protein MacB [Nymphon striatum]|nr:Macrolide export ATP-binding/permease protein MacB [Nymphon striatum]
MSSTVKSRHGPVDIELRFKDESKFYDLLVGYSADADIILQTNTDVMRIPSEAILDDTFVMLFNPSNNLLVKNQIGDETVHALDHVTVDIARGDYISIMGASGSGKSTLLNMLGLLDIPNSGSYTFEDKELTTLSEEKRAAFRRENALTDMGIEDRAKHLPKQLSGGQQQRVAIARAMILKPPLLLADEPTGNLDTHSGNEVIKVLEQLNDSGITLIVVTHDLELGNRAHRRIKMLDGKIIKDQLSAPNVEAAK